MKNNKNQISLGDRMKSYEKIADYQLMPNTYIVTRLDGRAFSKFTKAIGFKKPFDLDFVEAMKNATKRLIQSTHASLGYTQSDEVTLIFKPERERFSNRVEKLCSTLASEMTLYFYQELIKINSNYIEKLNKLNPIFDCRVFNVPSKKEALNAVLWREQDAVKNSILSLAQSVFSYKEMFKVNTKQLITKMEQEKNLRWDELPVYLKRGYYLVPRNKTVQIEENVWLKIPEKHRKPIQETLVERTIIEEDNSFLSLTQLEEDLF